MKKLTAIFLLVVLLTFGISSLVLADGTETLGPPSVSIASGSGIVAAGVGLQLGQPGTINVNVPGSVQQALLYWSGEFYANGAATDTILVDGANVVGDRIGGPAFFFNFHGAVYVAAYRADITSKVSAGANSLEIDGLDFDLANHGAGVLVIYDDGSGTSDIDLRDGVDLAYFGFSEPRKNTVPQTFTFDPEPADRIADLAIFASSVGAGRPNTIDISVGGVTTTLVNPLGSNDGELWDTISVPVSIPAGATSVTVQIFSTPTTNPRGASLSWIGAGLSVPVTPPGGEGCTPGYWRNHLESWPPTGLDPSDDFDTTFGVDYFDPDITLDEAVNAKGGGVKKVARHGTAALLSALHPAVDYPVSAADVIAAVQAGDVGDLADFNELSDVCPAEDFQP